MPASAQYLKSAKYAQLETVYSQCSGPGGLKLAEFLANKLSLAHGNLLLDVGTNWGYQTCFLAKEYGVFAVGIDPGRDPTDPTSPNVTHLMENARSWGVQNRILALSVSVPDTGFEDNAFDVAYSTTTLEMIRGFDGEDRYRESLSEIHRVLRPGALFGYGDPMHLDVEIPPDLAPLITQGDGCWADCFASLHETVDAFESVGFEIVEADRAPDARLWWEEYARYDPECSADPDGDPRAIRVDDGRWLTYGYVIAKKPK